MTTLSFRFTRNNSFFCKTDISLLPQRNNYPIARAVRAQHAIPYPVKQRTFAMPVLDCYHVIHQLGQAPSQNKILPHCSNNFPITLIWPKHFFHSIFPSLPSTSFTYMISMKAGKDLSALGQYAIPSEALENPNFLLLKAQKSLFLPKTLTTKHCITLPGWNGLSANTSL